MPASSRTAGARRVVVAATALALAFTFAPDLPAREPTSRDHDAIRVINWRAHVAGSFRSMVTNWGQIGSRPGTTSPGAGEPSFEWPIESGIEYLWSAGLWLGAMLNAEPHVTTTQYVTEARPGPSVLDLLYLTHEGATGGARAPDENADDDGDGRTDEDRLDGYDNDSDGSIDEDFAAISDEMYTGVFLDGDATIPEHHPLGVEIQQSTFAWTDPRIKDVLGIEWLIVNHNFNPLDNVLVGLFADCDIGPREGKGVAADDWAGFWDGNVEVELGGPLHTVRVSMGYMFDDDPTGPVAGWIGIVPLGTEILNSTPPAVPLATFRMFQGGSFEFGGDPTNDIQRYQVLDGVDPFALPPPDSTGFRPAQLAPSLADYRILVGHDDIEVVEPGDILRASFAIVIGEGFEGLRQNAARAVLLHANDWRVEGPVAVALQDLETLATAAGIQLSWRVADVGDVRSVAVMRRDDSGWLRERAVLPAEARMRYTDADVVPGQSYVYRIDLETHAGARITGREIEVRFDPGIPGRTTLATPRSRPDGSVEIEYRLAQSGRYDLALYDARGRSVVRIAGGDAAAGTYRRVWDGRSASGEALARSVYFLRLRSGAAVATAKLVRDR